MARFRTHVHTFRFKDTRKHTHTIEHLYTLTLPDVVF